MEKNFHVFGAYYGYCGGAVYDGGFFHKDWENDQVLDYSDIDKIGTEHPELSQVYNLLMQEIWKNIEQQDVDAPLKLTKHGLRLFNSTDSKDLYTSDEFDGDSLDRVSENWKLPLRFES